DFCFGFTKDHKIAASNGCVGISSIAIGALFLVLSILDVLGKLHPSSANFATIGFQVAGIFIPGGIFILFQKQIGQSCCKNAPTTSYTETTKASEFSQQQRDVEERLKGLKVIKRRPPNGDFSATPQ